MSNLEKIYCSMHELSDDFNEEPQEMKDAEDELEKLMGKELYTKFEIKILGYAGISHKDGFIKGFQYAVSLLTSGKAV